MDELQKENRRQGADGYSEYWPQVIGGMTFGQAIEAMKRGDKVSRSGWNGKGLWLELQAPDYNSKMTLPYIFMSYPSDAKTTPGARVPWLASQTDMLAEDWAIVE